MAEEWPSPQGGWKLQPKNDSEPLKPLGTDSLFGSDGDIDVCWVLPEPQDNM